MRHYSMLKTIPLSFYSKDLYRDVGKNWPGLGFAYVLFTMALLSIPLVLWLIVQSFSLTLDHPVNIRYVINQIPHIHIQNGELSTDVAMPHRIKDDETASTLAIIDTTRPISEWIDEISADDGVEGAIILGKKNYVIYQKHKSEAKIKSYPKDEDFSLNRTDVETLMEWALQYSWAFILIIAPFILGFLLVYRIIQLLIYGLFGMLIAKLLKVTLDYEDIVRIAAVAITPVIVLSFLDFVFTLNIPGLLAFAIAMGYLGFGIKANKDA